MVITVNNTDVTEKIVSDSVRWSRYGTFLTELTFAMETSGSDGTEIKTGMNAELFINGVKVWGGLICETKEVRRSDSRTAISVKCKGYESIAARKVSDAVHFENLTAGQIAAQIFQDYLVNEEDFLYDSENFDLDGELFESYSSAGAKISKLFDDLAQASGKKWWVTTEKSFCFKQSIPVTDSGYCIDLDGNSENSIKNVSAIKFSRKASDYRNIQIVFGKDNVRGEARNETEIARMAEFGGSGEYANVTVNRNILTEEAANDAAVNILRSYENDSVTVNFTTEQDGLEIFSKIALRAANYGYEDFTEFIITEINAKSLKNGKFVYEISARFSSDAEIGYRPPDGWTEQFGQLVNKNDGNVQGSGSGSGGGMSPYDILAGKNITLDKTAKTVTIHAVQEKLLALKKAEFTENGVSYTLENGAVCTYSFGFDSEGNLSSLTDESGNVITVSGI
ncbi:MAG: hypothetical protein E7481_03865 [Ruminococcaceae bacterium]|nr:hypothetical protein [Oscillospiraceae bacterium]